MEGMLRRDFLKWTGAGLAGTFIAPALKACGVGVNPNTQSEGKVEQKNYAKLEDIPLEEWQRILNKGGKLEEGEIKNLLLKTYNLPHQDVFISVIPYEGDMWGGCLVVRPGKGETEDERVLDCVAADNAPEQGGMLAGRLAVDTRGYKEKGYSIRSIGATSATKAVSFTANIEPVSSKRKGEYHEPNQRIHFDGVFQSGESEDHSITAEKLKATHPNATGAIYIYFEKK